MESNNFPLSAKRSFKKTNKTNVEIQSYRIFINYLFLLSKERNKLAIKLPAPIEILKTSECNFLHDKISFF